MTEVDEEVFPKISPLIAYYTVLKSPPLAISSFQMEWLVKKQEIGDVHALLF